MQVRAGTPCVGAQARPSPASATYADPFFMGLAAGFGLLSCDTVAVACVSEQRAVATAGRAMAT